MSDPSLAPSIVGRAVIELLDLGGSRPVPRITFDPVGRFTAGMVTDMEGGFPMHFAQEIEKAQAAVRHAARTAPPTPPSATPTRKAK